MSKTGNNNDYFNKTNALMFILILQFYKIIEECLKVGTQVGCICWKVTCGSTFVWLVSSRLEDWSAFFLAVKHPIFCDTVFCSFKGQVTENGLLDSFISGTSSRSPPYIWSSSPAPAQFNRRKKKFMTMFWSQNFHDIFCLLSLYYSPSSFWEATKDRGKKD